MYSLFMNNINDDQAFKDTIRYALHLGITDREIGNEFGVANSTVRRWAGGISSAHPAVRKPIFEWLKPKMFALIAQS